MISIEEAYELVTGAVVDLGSEQVELTDALHRVLAEDVISDVDMPPFDKSAMDGYACRHANLAQPLQIIETIAAGQYPKKTVEQGQCSAIMTGAPVPEGADCVIKVENTWLDENGHVIFTGTPGKSNISFKAEDVTIGELLVAQGTFLEPQHIAVLAATGYARPKVALKPHVAVISTGDEIVEPHEKPGMSKIRNSNAYQLLAQAEICGATATYMGIARDTEDETFQLIGKALKEHDVVILSGGISMGQFDFIPGVFERLGVEILFQTLAVQPGKPTVFGKLGTKRIFGLPGNPVSAFNTFELLVRPYLRQAMGAAEGWKIVRLAMGRDFTRRRSERDSFIPVLVSEGKVFPKEYHGSGHIHALTDAFGFIRIPRGTTELKEGEWVDVRQI